MTEQLPDPMASTPGFHWFADNGLDGRPGNNPTTPGAAQRIHADAEALQQLIHVLAQLYTTDQDTKP